MILLDDKLARKILEQSFISLAYRVAPNLHCLFFMGLEFPLFLVSFID